MSKKIFHFIWNAKPAKIKRAYLYNEYEFGGLQKKPQGVTLKY